MTGVFVLEADFDKVVSALAAEMPKMRGHGKLVASNPDDVQKDVLEFAQSQGICIGFPPAVPGKSRFNGHTRMTMHEFYTRCKNKFVFKAA